MISFRVSAEEYHKLRAACTAEGVASVSELARSAIHSIIQRNGSPAPAHEQIADLRQRVEGLAADIERLAREVNSAPSAGAACTVSGD